MHAYKTAAGAWQLNFCENGKQRTLYLGRGYTSSAADRIAKVVLELIALRKMREPLPAALLQKIESFPDRIRQNMNRIGLSVECRSRTLSELCRAKIESVKHLKESTLRKYREAAAQLIAFLGKERTLISVTKTDCERFRADWLRHYAASSVSRGIRQCRTIFRFAVEQDWLTKNPFDKVPGGIEVNLERQVYVDRETVRRVMRASELDTDRLLLALARFGGLRIPSEIRQLRWSDFAGGVIKIHKDTKTGAREVPFFGEIREVFTRLVQPADLTGRIFGKLGGFRYRILSAIGRGGVPAWVKLFVNLRSSCITDLAERGYSDKTLDAIFGNSAAVRAKHYLQFRKEREYARVLSEDALLMKVDRSGECSDVSDDILLRKLRQIWGCPGENSDENQGVIKLLVSAFGTSRHAG